MSFPTKWDQVFLVYTPAGSAWFGSSEWLVQDRRTGKIIATCGTHEKASEIAEKRFEQLKEEVEKILLGQ